ncbi:MAG: cobalt-precorrin-5B (C(1))-methyltransferase [Oribacterium sp.]|nr:cobalt-precorrin-5B (C(1))-methyltransferase [Oribacterium sp.]
MKEYIYKNQKQMRRGLTTGTCAAACTRAAMERLMTGNVAEEVNVVLPGGEIVTLSVYPVGESEFYTIKDSGDDPDVTNGTEVHVKAERVTAGEVPENAFICEDNPRLFLTGGKGVGTVTKPGLQQEVGQSAINPVPREMIFRTALDVLELCQSEDDKCFLITVSVPEGEELAKKTFNPRLGIEGGISILGTTGIVEPMSEASIVATIETEIRQKLYSQRKEASHELKAGTPEAETDLTETEPGAVSSIIAVPGNYGMRYVEKLGLDTERVVTVSNYIGDAIDLAISYGCREFLLVGNIGKLCKLAAGIMNTYSKVADGRWEIFAAHLALCGGDASQIRAVKEAATTEEMLTLLEEIGLREIVMASIMKEIEFHMEQRIKGQMKFGVIVYSERFGMVGKAGEVD